MGISEIVYNDPSTMERIAKIVSALWNKTLVLCDSANTGFAAFYHINGTEEYELNERMSIEEYQKRDIFEIANDILNIIIDLDDDNYTFLTDALSF